MPSVVALVGDLMDRSRVTGAIPEAQVVKAASAVTDAEVVIVDIGRHAAAVAELRRRLPHAWIVAYGRHDDQAALGAAGDAGADRVLARSRFFADPAAAIARPRPPDE
jgi:DNA-binding NarL/FixJ family response regulator